MKQDVILLKQNYLTAVEKLQQRTDYLRKEIKKSKTEQQRLELERRYNSLHEDMVRCAKIAKQLEEYCNCCKGD